MSKFTDRSKIRKQEIKEQNRVARKERLRLKALPKVLRKLETEFSKHVSFMEVYDGYLGDFTGEIVPVEPVGNPFAIIRRMGLNFPHPNSLCIEQKNMYINTIEDAFNRMGFMINYFTIVAEGNAFELSDAEVSQLYELLLFHIMVSKGQDFDIFSSVNYEGLTLEITRFNCDYFY